MKKQIPLTTNEMGDSCDIHKDMMRAIARHTFKYKDDKNFEIFSFAIALTISNTLIKFGITDIDTFLNDMVETIKRIHQKVKENSSYMQFKYGKKMDDGSLN